MKQAIHQALLFRSFFQFYRNELGFNEKKKSLLERISRQLSFIK